MEDIPRCKECKRSGTVLDHITGESICDECGVVLDSRDIDEASEWQDFNDETRDHMDPSRVGTPSNPPLTHANPSTIISPGKKSGSLPAPEIDTNEPSPDSVLIKGFQAIDTIAERLTIVSKVKNRAQEIFKNVHEQKICKMRNLNSVYGACLLVACREDKSSSTLNEIVSAAAAASKKEVSGAVELIMKHLGVGLGTLHAGELARRFCSKLGMKNQDMKAVQEAVKKSEGFDTRRRPASVVAAIIYAISQLSDDKKPIQEICGATQVYPATIKKSYRDIHPHLRSIIPDWFASEEDIGKLMEP